MNAINAKSALSQLKHLMGLGNQNPSQPQSVSSNNLSNLHTKKSNETYQAYGVRMAGIHSGNLQGLAPSLQGVILQEKAAQAADEQMRQTYRANLESEKRSLESQKEGVELKIKESEEAIKDIETKIAENNSKIADLKEVKEDDKLTNLSFFISCFIVVLLTVYLFVFYSSASYSAIYMSADEVLESGLATHIFNPKAIELAYTNGFFALLLVILLPVIFLGLGFLIHQYSLEKGFGKYLKVSSLIGVNFIFDAILAYRISKTMYDLEGVTQLTTQPPYSVDMAFQSADFWLVIFAGFIAYIIWGLVFASMMDAYGKKTSNKHLIVKLTNEITALENKKGDEKSKISDNQQKIINYNAKISEIDIKIQNGVIIDYGRIKRCLTDFFNGWLSILNGLGATISEKAAAQACFNNEINSLHEKNDSPQK